MSAVPYGERSWEISDSNANDTLGWSDESPWSCCSVMLPCDKILAAANNMPAERFDTCDACDLATFCYHVKFLAVRKMFFDSQLRSIKIVSSQPHCSSNTNANMATSLWADDVCTLISHN